MKEKELLEELARLDEQKNKQLMTARGALIMTNLVFFLGIIGLVSSLLEEGIVQGIIIAASTVFFIIVALITLKIEVYAGYYECQDCNEKFVPTYKQALLAPHIGAIRLMKCPKCNNKTWTKKVMSK